MDRMEALYVVEFGDVVGFGYRNGGVAVLETNRIYGGDSGYYYLGTFTIRGDRIEANVKVVKHNPNWNNVFGDGAASFGLVMCGIIGDGIIEGFMERIDKRGPRLPIRMIRKEILP